jgi:tetratricopeptide (TPR) repeat protein
MRGYLAEGLERLDQILALPDASNHPVALADALSAAAGLAYWQADADRSRALYEREIEARRALGDRRGLAEALYGISFTWSVIGLQEKDNAVASMAYVNEALAIFSELGDVSGVGRCQWALANIAYGMGRSDDARSHVKDALAVFEAIDDRFMVGWASYTMALAELSDFYAGADVTTLREASRWLRQ